MADFNPDDYLKAKGISVEGFDPDAYLQSKVPRETQWNLLRERGGMAPASSPVAKSADMAAMDATAQYVAPAVATIAGGPALGALTASAANSAVQARRELMGEQDGFKKGEAIAAPVSMLASPLGRGALNAVGNTAINAAGAYGMEKVRSALDDPQGAQDNASRVAGIVAAVTAASPAIGSVLGRIMNNVAPEEAARIAQLVTDNGPRDAGLAAGRRVGMKPIPSMVNRGNVVPDLLESIGGSGATKKAFQEANSAAAMQAGKRHAGVSPGAALDEESLAMAEVPHAAAYDKAGAIGDAGRAELDAVKQRIGVSSDPMEQAIATEANQAALDKARALGGADIEAWKAAKKEVNRMHAAPYHLQDPKAIDAAEAAVSVLEDRIYKAGVESGDPSLLAELMSARRGFGKVNDIRRVMNQPGGSINTKKVVLAYQKDPGKMTGELADVGAFGKQFGDVIGDGTSHMDPGNSGTNVAGAIELLLRNKPVAAAATLLNPRLAARNALKSDFIQNRYAVPNYTPNTSRNPELDAIMARIAALSQLQNQGRL